MLKNKIVDNTISKSKNFYTFYQRYGRQDIVVKVPTDDLREIAKSIPKKIET